MEKRRGFTVRTRILMLSVLPVTIIGMILLIVGILFMKNGMEEEVIEGLMNSARVYHDLRIEEPVVEDDHSMEEDLKEKTGYEYTYFKGDSRLLTSLDKSVVGTPAADAVIDAVLKGGNEFHSKNTSVAGKPFFVAYVPVKDDSGAVVGMCFAGKSRESVESTVGKSRNVMIAITVILFAVTFIISFRSASVFASAIKTIEESVMHLSKGEFIKADKYIERADEIGEALRSTNSLIDTLTEIVSGVKEASSTVGEQSAELADTCTQISESSDGVSEAVQEMAKGATEQADAVQRATENINILSDAIQTVADNAEQLAGEAAQMNDASLQSAEALKNLSSNMDKMGGAVRQITETMKATNGAVDKVNEKVDGITSIASQTNLLALNASIEAARAGEAGRGFAVVAEEIGKLATESAQTAGEIRDEMSNLLGHSQEATKKTDEVSAIGEDVTSVLSDTVGIINSLIENVTSAVDGVNTISGLTEECNASKEQIVDAMSSLSAISEENAASTEETSATMQELNATVNVLAGSSESLKDVVVKLDSELEFFKL